MLWSLIRPLANSNVSTINKQNLYYSTLSSKHLNQPCLLCVSGCFIRKCWLTSPALTLVPVPSLRLMRPVETTSHSFLLWEFGLLISLPIMWQETTSKSLGHCQGGARGHFWLFITASQSPAWQSKVSSVASNRR